MPKIYTRTGDSGESSVKGGRVRKDALVFDVLGTLDELGAWLGAIKLREAASERPFFEEIQLALLSLGSDVAGYRPFATALVPALESAIDRLMSPMNHEPRATNHEPRTTTFTLRPCSGRIHVVRTVCRRAERLLVAFRPTHPGVPFLNRLSDYLYALAEAVPSGAAF